jgi:peptidyl-tRNA hydrolase
VDFVLGKWQATEMEFVTPGVERAIKLLETFILAGPQMAMNQYNQ